MAVTTVPTVVTGELWSAADQNTYLRDNVNPLIADRNKQSFQPAMAGYNTTDSIALLLDSLKAGFSMTDAKVTYIMGGIYTPTRFVETMTIKAIVIPSDTGFIYARLRAYGGADGEAQDTIDVQNSYSQITASTGMAYLLTAALTITGVAAGDIVIPHFERDATHASDTINNVVYGIGFLIEYTEANYG